MDDLSDPLLGDPAGWPSEEDDPSFFDALLDLTLGPPTIPPGDGAYASIPARPWRSEGLESADPIDDFEDDVFSTN